MDVDRPDEDARWDARQRDETETQRLDRNWASLLQELRVVQTGVQLLTGFLLTLPFQQRFDILADDMQRVYLATVSVAVLSTALLIAPVGMHRLLFRRHQLAALVSAAHVCAYAGLVVHVGGLTGIRDYGVWRHIVAHAPLGTRAFGAKTTVRAVDARLCASPAGARARTR